MADNTNATCIICGKRYRMCLSCRDYARTHPWQIYTDNAEHYVIHQIIKGYNSGVYTKNEAKEKLSNIDLTELDSFLPEVKEVLEAIIKDESKVSEDVVDVVNITDIIPDDVNIEYIDTEEIYEDDNANKNDNTDSCFNNSNGESMKDNNENMEKKNRKSKKYKK